MPRVAVQQRRTATPLRRDVPPARTRRSTSPRCAANLATCAREGARHAGARGGQGERLRPRPDARPAGARRADGLALVELDAAIVLRERRYSRRILLLEGFFDDRELPEFAQRRLATVVHDTEQVRMLEKAVMSRPLEVFIKVNAGMNRLGFRARRVAGVASGCRVAGGRRAAADDALRARRRGRRHRRALARFRAPAAGSPYPRSIANSAGVIRYAEVGGDIVRPGIMLYGASPFPVDTAACSALRR